MSNLQVSAVIVDDDPIATEQLKDLLEEFGEAIKLVQVCKNGKAGIKAIDRFNPDLIFLDVVMPGMTGFDMLRELPGLKAEVIFTTTFNEYAIQAIRFAALDYLLKPLQADQFREAVSRAIKKISAKKGMPKLTRAETDVAKELGTLPVPSMDGILFVKVADVLYCEADGRITKIFLTDKKMVASTRTLGDFEELLLAQNFYRIHKSHLINLKHLKKYIRGEGGQVVLTDNTTLDVSRREKKGLLDQMAGAF